MAALHTNFAKGRANNLIARLLYGANVDRNAKARARVGLAIAAFVLVYAAIAARLIFFGVMSDGAAGKRSTAQDAVATARPDILDRNGEILATDVRTPSLFAEPRKIIDVDEAVELLTATLPDLDARELRERLSSKRGFIWLKREVTPKQQQDIHKLGIPGVGFLTENKRVYPNGAVVSHVIGHVNIDNQGIAGIEKWLDARGLADLHMAGFATDRLQKPVELAVDLRVQHALRDELLAAQQKYKVKVAAAGLVTDVRTGEVIAMVSVPDYDPNNPREALAVPPGVLCGLGGVRYSHPNTRRPALDPSRINRLTTGVFEMGSTFKALTMAMALDSGKVTLASTFDARQPLRYGKFEINDYHAQKRILSVPEIFTYSSNIGTAKMALALGVDYHKAFLRKMGQLDRLRTEIPESAEPLAPKNWSELSTVTVAFGHGIAVAPLQAVMAVGALMNGGKLIPPTFLKRSEAEAAEFGKQVVKPETSDRMRYLMRLNAEIGTAKSVNIPGYYVGGKTGTSEKVVNGQYSKTRLLAAFMAVFPSDKPRYLVTILLDEPQPTPETKGFATSGWNAAPTAGLVVKRIAPMLGITPRFDLPTADRQILAVTAGTRQ